MLRVLKNLFDDQPAPARALPGHERRHLMLAVASLLHEVTRVDLAESDVERAAAELALADLFGLSPPHASDLLAEGRERVKQLTSYFAPVSVIKRDMALAERVRLIEHLWRIAYADRRLDSHEDHYVRKIAHLLYVPNTQSMLARNRARGAPGSANGGA
ncbi:MAG TPA: TerB family tellurite resistance protein [Burkholderiales bacterium]|nr:TerB family tellurite resistance protein [Burkholderiales bacterium]